MNHKQNIAIIGGGIVGLSAAYYLSKDRKCKVSVFEKNKEFGGLLGLLEVNGVGLEGYYHHLAKSDNEIIGLIKELSLGDKLLYLPSKLGIFYNNKIYPFSSPLDLLRFPEISILSRLRLGLAALYLQKLVTNNNWRKLQNSSASQWLKKYVGREGYKVIWEPLLTGKFGPFADKVSMAWLWSRIHWRGNSRTKSTSQEELVYLRGGFKILIDKMIEEIKKKGGKLYTNSKVTKISYKKGCIRLAFNNNLIKAETFNKGVVTIPNPLFIKLAPDLTDQMKKRLLKVKYRGAMVAVLKLKKQFMEDVYWLNIHEDDMQILAVVEHTNFVDAKYYGGAHLLYAGNYTAQDDPVMNMNSYKLINLITKELKRINPLFNKSWIEKYWIFRDKYAQPVVTCNYHTFIPPIKTGIKNLYLTNMAQVYPEDRGVNQAVRDGKTIADRITSGQL